MKLFGKNQARDKPGNKPNYGLMRSVNRTRGDYALSTSEAIFAAVSRISNTMAMLPMHLYKGMEVQRNDPREKLVSYAPNAAMNPFTFQQSMEVFRNTEGNAYALIVPSEDGKGIGSLDVLDAARVVPVRETATREIWYQLSLDDGQSATVHSSSVVVLHHVSANGEKGIRPVDVLRGTLDYDRQVKEFSLSQLEGVNAAVVLNVPGTGLSPEKKKEVINQFLSAYRESGGRLVVLEGGITSSSMNNSPVDAKVLDVERITKNRVATVYNLPPHMLGDYTDTSYSTAEQSKREYLDLTILPILTQWEQEYNRKLLTWREKAEGYEFRFDTRELQRADAQAMAEMYQKAIRSGWMLVNEVRAIERLPEDPSGNELLVSRDLVPLRVALCEQAVAAKVHEGRRGTEKTATGK